MAFVLILLAVKLQEHNELWYYRKPVNFFILLPLLISIRLTDLWETYADCHKAI